MKSITNIIIIILATSFMSFGQTEQKSEASNNIRPEYKGVIKLELLQMLIGRQELAYEFLLNKSLTVQLGGGITYKPLMETYSNNSDVAKKNQKIGGIASVGINYYLLDDAPRSLNIGLQYKLINQITASKDTGLGSEIINNNKSMRNTASVRLGYQHISKGIVFDIYASGGLYLQKSNIAGELCYCTSNRGAQGEVGVKVGFGL